MMQRTWLESLGILLREIALLKGFCMCYGDGSSGDAFPTKKLVAEEFEKHKKAIWSWLMSDEASSNLAVYGIWGCGKNNIAHTYLQSSSKTTETFSSCFLDHCISGF
jgi:hypothetical protein